MAQRSREMRRKVTYDLIKDETGLSKSTLAKLANDKSRFLSVEAVDRLCVFFDCQPGDFFIHVQGS